MPDVSESARATMVKLHGDAAKKARLYNFGVAVRAHLANGEAATWIPVQPSAADIGGRPSLYDLKDDTETLMGSYITERGAAVHEYVTKTGTDEYSMKQTTTSGRVLFEGRGTLEVLNADTGYGRIAYKGKDGRLNAVHVWVAWSFIKVDVD